LERRLAHWITAICLGCSAFLSQVICLGDPGQLVCLLTG
jgi:hypothetical protein